ncbi:MAG: TonB-dependent receptor [Asticcacaulis sp.]
MRPQLSLTCSLFCLLSVTHAFAQTQSGSAAASSAPARGTQAQAADAFGNRAGLEINGLYNEGQARGFNLGTTGAYRLDGMVFRSIGGLPDVITEDVSVLIGVNGAQVNQPSPSGVVNYRLKGGGEQRSPSRLTVGIRDQQASPFLVLDVEQRSDDNRHRFVGGVQLRPEITYTDYSQGRGQEWGGVYRYLGDARQVSVFAAQTQYRYHGDFGFYTRTPSRPYLPDNQLKFGPDDARTDVRNQTLGLQGVQNLGSNTRLEVSVIEARQHFLGSDYTFLGLDETPQASATLYHNPRRSRRNLAAQVQLTQTFGALGAEHSVALVSRQTRERWTEGGQPGLDLGLIDLRDPVFPKVIYSHDDGRRDLNKVRNDTYGVTWFGRWGEGLEVRAGVDRTRFDKSFALRDGSRNERNLSHETLGYASVLYRPTPRLSLFASYVKGLENSGVAPIKARNAYAVLPPVIAEQWEAGGQYRLTPDLTLISALFRIEKPFAGMRDDDIYGFVGDIRHQGLEVSLSGRLSPQTQISLGAVAMSQQLSGPLVAAGRVGKQPPGTSPRVVNLTLNHTIAAVPGLSVDANLAHNSARAADNRNSWTIPAYTRLNLGARYVWHAFDRPLTLRAYVTNVTGETAFVGQSWGQNLLFDRTIRLSLTAPVG